MACHYQSSFSQPESTDHLFFCVSSCFQNNVEIHVAHIQSGLSQLGNLHAFAANNTNAVWVPVSATHRCMHTQRCGPFLKYHLLRWCFHLNCLKKKKKDWKQKALVDAVDHHHTVWIWMSSVKRLRVLQKLCSDGREDVSKYFTHPFYCMKMLVHPIEHKPERVLNYCHQSNSPNSMVIYWFHVPNIDSYSFYSPYLFIFE